MSEIYPFLLFLVTSILVIALISALLYKRFKKIFILVIGGVLVFSALMALVTVFFGWQSYWKVYSNEVYGFEFKYPQTWNLDETTTSFLDIHATINTTDGPECPAGFRGIEIQVGLPLDQETDFTYFVRSQTMPSGIGLYPSGKITEESVKGHQVLKVENSGWDSGCRGPGYFIKQSARKYTYMYTGGDGVDSEYWDLIVASFRFK